MEYESFKNRLSKIFDIDPVSEKTAEHLLENYHILDNFPKDVRYATALWFVNKFVDDEQIYSKDYANVVGVKKKTLFELEKILFEHYMKNPLEGNRIIYGYTKNDQLL